MQQNFWEQGNLMKVNFREHLNLFLGNKGKTPIFSREQGNMYPPPPREALENVATMYYLMDIIPWVTQLNSIFQKEDLDVSII